VAFAIRLLDEVRETGVGADEAEELELASEQDF